MSCIYGSQALSIIVARGRMEAYYSVNKGLNWKVLTERPYYSCLVTDNKIIISGKYGISEVFNYSIK